MTAKVITLRPLDFEIQRSFGGHCLFCEFPTSRTAKAADLRGLAVHRKGCLFPFNWDDPLAPCRCGASVAHVQLDTRGEEWLRKHYELVCCKCQQNRNGIEGSL